MKKVYIVYIGDEVHAIYEKEENAINKVNDLKSSGGVISDATLMVEFELDD